MQKGDNKRLRDDRKVKMMIRNSKGRQKVRNDDNKNE